MYNNDMSDETPAWVDDGVLVEARLPEWYRNPVLDAPYGAEVWIRSTPTYRGTVIHPGGNYEAPPEYSWRRYSVAIRHPGNHWELLVGSTHYDKDGFDTEDVDEPLEKFLAGQFATLYRIPTNRTTDMQDATVEWQGDAQYLKRNF